MPIYFRWIGRLSAPIFAFCVVEGILKTRNKKIYLLRMYFFSTFMSIMDFILMI